MKSEYLVLSCFSLSYTYGFEMNQQHILVIRHSEYAAEIQQYVLGGGRRTRFGLELPLPH